MIMHLKLSNIGEPACVRSICIKLALSMVLCNLALSSFIRAVLLTSYLGAKGHVMHQLSDELVVVKTS